MHKLILASLIFLASLGPASAHWKFTHWGMTPQQVVKASGGKAVQAPSPSGHDANDGSKRALLVMPYKSGDLGFKAFFIFSTDNKLDSVDLELVSGSQGLAVQALDLKYGDPVMGDSFFRVYRTQIDQITLYRGQTDAEATVHYAPRPAANASGL